MAVTKIGNRYAFPTNDDLYVGIRQCCNFIIENTPELVGGLFDSDGKSLRVDGLDIKISISVNGLPTVTVNKNHTVPIVLPFAEDE